MNLSLCLITRNEEANLATCLASCHSLADEIVVVDTGSTDGTRQVAHQFGARIFECPWDGSFSNARNIGLQHATGDWIFSLDADEYFDQENRERLRALVHKLGMDSAAFSLRQRSLTEDSPVFGVSYDQVRLFRNLPEIRWEGRTHEVVTPSLKRLGHRIQQTDIEFVHTGYQDSSLVKAKCQRDFLLLQMDDAERPNNPYTLYHLGATHLSQEKPDQAVDFLRRAWQYVEPGSSLRAIIAAAFSQSLRLAGQATEALAVCAAIRHVIPEDQNALFEESLVRRALGDLAGVEDCLLRMLSAPAPQYLTCLDLELQGSKGKHNLAVLYRDQHRWSEAESLWREVLEATPQYSPAIRGLAELYFRLGHPASMLPHIDRLSQLPNGQGDSLILYGRYYLLNGQFEAARHSLEEAISLLPLNPVPLLLQAEIALQLGDTTTARTWLHRALEIEPSNSTALDGIKFIERA